MKIKIKKVLFSLMMSMALIYFCAISFINVNASTSTISTLQVGDSVSSVYLTVANANKLGIASLPYCPFGQEVSLTSSGYQNFEQGLGHGVMQYDLITFSDGSSVSFFEVEPSYVTFGHSIYAHDGYGDDYNYIGYSFSGVVVEDNGTSFANSIIDGTPYIEIPLPETLTVSTLSNDVVFLKITTAENKQPIFDGQTGFVTNVDNPVTVDYIKSQLTCIDNEDGDISDRIVVKTDGYSTNKNVVGTYHIIFTCEDNAGNVAELDVTVLVSDITPPSITGPSTYNAKITTLTSTDTIKNTLTFSDNYYLSNELVVTVVTDNYSSNYNKVGTYDVVFKCTDPKGNYSTYTVSVIVKDNVPPVFSGPTTITKNQSKTLTLSDIKSQLSASDYVDGNITSRIQVVTDNYTGCGNRAGSYTITFSVTDTAGNKTEKTVTINVIDDIPPVFYVDNYFIKIFAGSTLTNQDIVDLLIATGQITGSSSKTIRFINNEYTGNENNVGIYPVSINVRSTDGSEDDINIAVQVVDDMETPPTDDDIVIPDSNKLLDFFNYKLLFMPVWAWLVSILGLFLVIKLFGSSKFRRKW